MGENISERQSGAGELVTPFAPSAAWTRRYLLELYGGADDISARRAASRGEGVCGKGFSRCILPGGNGEETLSIPLAGGASSLKRRGANPILSEHGKWRREHLGAWNAAYGRTPFFPFLMPEIKEVYENSEGISLEDFNRRMLDVALRIILAEDLRGARGRNPELGLRARELETIINMRDSIFGALFRFGKEAALAIAST